MISTIDTWTLDRNEEDFFGEVSLLVRSVIEKTDEGQLSEILGNSKTAYEVIVKNTFTPTLASQILSEDTTQFSGSALLAITSKSANGKFNVRTVDLRYVIGLFALVIGVVLFLWLKISEYNAEVTELQAAIDKEYLLNATLVDKTVNAMGGIARDVGSAIASFGGKWLAGKVLPTDAASAIKTATDSAYSIQPGVNAIATRELATLKSYVELLGHVYHGGIVVIAIFLKIFAFRGYYELKNFFSTPATVTDIRNSPTARPVAVTPVKTVVARRPRRTGTPKAVRQYSTDAGRAPSPSFKKQYHPVGQFLADNMLIGDISSARILKLLAFRPLTDRSVVNKPEGLDGLKYQLSVGEITCEHLELKEIRKGISRFLTRVAAPKDVFFKYDETRTNQELCGFIYSTLVPMTR